jgi:hypothetical protein
MGQQVGRIVAIGEDGIVGGGDLGQLPCSVVVEFSGARGATCGGLGDLFDAATGVVLVVGFEAGGVGGLQQAMSNVRPDPEACEAC